MCLHQGFGSEDLDLKDHLPVGDRDLWILDKFSFLIYCYRQINWEERRELYRSYCSHYAKMVLAHYRGISQLPLDQVRTLSSQAVGFWHVCRMTHPKIPRVFDFSAIWWPILKNFLVMMGTHGAHKYTKFREDPIMYAELRPKKPRR